MSEQQPEKSLNEAFEEVEEILEKLRAQEVSLEDSFALYQSGMELLKYCSDRIDAVEKKVLALNEEGELDEFQ